MRLPKGFKKALKKSKDLQLQVYDKVLGDKISAMPLDEQVRLARKLSIGPMPVVRANLLKQLPPPEAGIKRTGEVRDWDSIY